GSPQRCESQPHDISRMYPCESITARVQSGMPWIKVKSKLELLAIKRQRLNNSAMSFGLRSATETAILRDFISHAVTLFIILLRIY
ncbi:MAG: hypothetical protein WC340_11775, partial [Kiritimatiellia bacterium]